MKKSEMKANNIKTASLQRLFRKWHQVCVFDNASDLIVKFGEIKKGQGKEWHSLCSDCLIDKHTDLGFHPATIQQMRKRQPQGEDEQ